MRRTGRKSCLLRSSSPISNLERNYGTALAELRDIVGAEKLAADRRIEDFIRAARRWLKSIMGSFRGESPPFVLT
jgi:hypothetical protein